MANKARKPTPKTEPYNIVGSIALLDSEISSMDMHSYKQMLLRISRTVEYALIQGKPPPNVGR